jgi:hypothetical protein
MVPESGLGCWIFGKAGVEISGLFLSWNSIRKESVSFREIRRFRLAREKDRAVAEEDRLAVGHDQG